VTATAAEVAPLTADLGPFAPPLDRLAAYQRGAHQVEVLRTGVGMVATAAWLSHFLAVDRYHLVLNLGVCGSFRPDLPPGTVVHVIADRLPELGAEDDDVFLSVHDLQLLGEDEFPFISGELRNANPPANAALARLRTARGITVNTVHGNEASIARIVERADPDVESMEGAAFMYACLVAGVPFAHVRAVSNFVERRNRSAWKLRDAINALGDTAFAIIDCA
jgi:futalosine hydrolase